MVVEAHGRPVAAVLRRYGAAGGRPRPGVTQGETFTSGRPGKDRNGVLGGAGATHAPPGAGCARASPR